ncbi:RNA polymerase sigma factor [Spirillospora sp. NBC_00431]
MINRPDPREVPDFGVWFRENGGRLLNYAQLFVQRKSQAEDIAQEAATKILKAWTDEEKRELIMTSDRYVRRIVRNCYLDYQKVPSRTSGHELEFDEQMHGDASLDIVSSWEVREAILRLPDEEREILFLVFYKDLQIRDAARKLGIPYFRAYRLLQRAKKKSAQLLKEEED